MTEREDIEYRLRNTDVWSEGSWPHGLLHEAADEIERLRAEKSKFLKAWDKAYGAAERWHHRSEAAEKVVEAARMGASPVSSQRMVGRDEVAFAYVDSEKLAKLRAALDAYDKAMK